jgi:hypothetical protein
MPATVTDIFFYYYRYLYRAPPFAHQVRPEEAAQSFLGRRANAREDGLFSRFYDRGAPHPSLCLRLFQLYPTFWSLGLFAFHDVINLAFINCLVLD